MTSNIHFPELGMCAYAEECSCPHPSSQKIFVVILPRLGLVVWLKEWVQMDIDNVDVGSFKFVLLLLKGAFMKVSF